MEWCGGSFSIVISNQRDCFLNLYLCFFLLQEGLWKAAFPVGTEVYCFEEFILYFS